MKDLVLFLFELSNIVFIFETRDENISIFLHVVLNFLKEKQFRFIKYL